MPDLTVTWKGAVPFEAAYGQSQTGADTKGVVADAAAMAKGFDIRPVLDATVASALAGAVPYVSEDWDEVVEGEFDTLLVENAVSKRGRPKKEG